MLRTVIAVLVGYVVMALLVFATFSLALLALGNNRAFRPGTYDPSTLWVVTSIVLSFIAAVAGGWVCATIAKESKAPLALAALILGLGLLWVGYVTMAPGDARLPARRDNTGNVEAIEAGRQPLWVSLLNPVIGAGGIILGARLKGRARNS